MIDWQRVQGRRDLPWQGTRDAYRIWLSEIMLQQTQVATVIPYYRRFIERFDSIGQLAAAGLDEVLTLWSGLGYYSRARNLHRAAQAVVAEHGGRFPRCFEQVIALPGIGRSTAGAICAIAFGQRHAILDGNVKRVLARHAAIEGWPGDSRVQAKLWQEAQARLPGGVDCAPANAGLASPGEAGCASRIAIYTQAMMDLGAGICARGRPRCEACPVAGDCAGRSGDRLHAIPAARPRKVLPQRTASVWVLVDAAQQVLLEQRPPSGIWGGLWSLPQTLAASAEARIRACPDAVQPLAPIEHGFTHFRLTLHPLLVRLARAALDEGVVAMPLAAEPGHRWQALAQIEAIALPAPIRTLLETLRARAVQPKSTGLQSLDNHHEGDHV